MIVIEDFMIRDLKLKGLELLAYALIHECSQAGGGLIGNFDVIAQAIGGTKPGATKVIGELVERGLVTRSELVTDTGKKFKIYQSAARSTMPEEVKPEPKNDANAELQEIAERIYKLYPTKCPTSQRATGKSKSDIVKIVRLLKKGHTEEELSGTIQRYISEATQNKSWIQNFSTFLNNLPDYSEQEASEPQLFNDNRRKPQR